MVYTATWIPPGLCGCKLLITADWTEPNDGTVKYRHPISHTITDIKIISVCATHVPNSQTMMDTSVFFSDMSPDPFHKFLNQKYNSVTPTPRQCRGYLTYPIANPTPAQMLYSFLSTHAGQHERLQCGCTRYGFSDETNYEAIMKHDARDLARNKVYIHHPVHTKHCHHHINDSADCIQAVADHDAFMTTQSQADVAAG